MQHEGKLDAAAADELFEILPVALQAAVARGDVELGELLERLTSASPDEELCPWCCARAISNTALGLCNICAHRRLRDMQRERMTELELTRERNAIKARIKRTRDELDPDRPRRQTRRAASKRAADYGLISIFASDHPDTIECGVCGRRMGAHGRDVCDECEQRLETRAARR